MGPGHIYIYTLYISKELIYKLTTHGYASCKCCTVQTLVGSTGERSLVSEIIPGSFAVLLRSRSIYSPPTIIDTVQLVIVTTTVTLLLFFLIHSLSASLHIHTFPHSRSPTHTLRTPHAPPYSQSSYTTHATLLPLLMANLTEFHSSTATHINMHLIQIYRPHLHSAQFKRVQYNQKSSSLLQVGRWQKVQFLSADKNMHQSIIWCAPTVEQTHPGKTSIMPILPDIAYSEL